MERKNEKRKDVGKTVAHVATEENEVFTFAYAPSDVEAAIDPFSKRPSLARTPPLRRTMSLPRDGQLADRVKGRVEDKRKRSEDSPPETSKKSRETRPTRDTDFRNGGVRLLTKVSELIERVDKSVKELVHITSGSRNTKLEIKDIAEELSVLMQELAYADIRKLSVANGDDKPETREMGTQTEQRGRLRSQMTEKADGPMAVTTLEGCHTIETWHEVAE